MDDLARFPIKRAQELPGPLLWHASKLWLQALNTALRPMGLSSTNGVILVNLLHLTFEQQPATQVRIAKLSGVDLMTTSAALRTLERKGFVARTTSAADKRANQLSLTPLGEQTALAALGVIAQTHQQFFAPLAADGSADTFRESLQKLIAANSQEKQ